jgi:hypothetical protein
MPADPAPPNARIGASSFGSANRGSRLLSIPTATKVNHPEKRL